MIYLLAPRESQWWFTKTIDVFMRCRTRGRSVFLLFLADIKIFIYIYMTSRGNGTLKRNRYKQKNSVDTHASWMNERLDESSCALHYMPLYKCLLWYYYITQYRFEDIHTSCWMGHKLQFIISFQAELTANHMKWRRHAHMCMC